MARGNNHGLISVLIGFGRALRAKGLAVGSGDIITYGKAMTSMDPTDLVDLYWTGRTCLVTKHDDIPVYDEVFRSYFLAVDSPIQEILKLKSQASAEAEAAFEVPSTAPPGEENEEEALLGFEASNTETLKRRSFDECTPEELAALRRIMARMRLTPPKRRTRRTKTANDGRRPDMPAESLARQAALFLELVPFLFR